MYFIKDVKINRFCLFNFTFNSFVKQCDPLKKNGDKKCCHFIETKVLTKVTKEREREKITPASMKKKYLLQQVRREKMLQQVRRKKKCPSKGKNNLLKVERKKLLPLLHSPSWISNGAPISFK